jgi:hypothetical protein
MSFLSTMRNRLGVYEAELSKEPQLWIEDTLPSDSAIYNLACNVIGWTVYFSLSRSRAREAT